MQRPLRNAEIDVCGRADFVRGEDMPLLEHGVQINFSCTGCGDCCRGREDLVLSGVDLWRLAGRLRLPPRVVSRGFCRESIGRTSRLPVLRLAPVRTNGNSCPFLSHDRCAVHDAKPLACALYPLGQEIGPEGEARYFFQGTDCGRTASGVKLEDYLTQSGVLAREAMDLRWARVCMRLEPRVQALEVQLESAVRRRMDAALWRALYYDYDGARPYLPQLDANLAQLDTRLEKLAAYQQRRSIEKNDR